MKTSIFKALFTVLFLTFSVTSLAKTDPVSIDLSYQGDGHLTPGGSATIEGVIKSAKVNQSFWDWLFSFFDNLHSQGLEIVATFPDESHDVTSQIQYLDSGKKEIKFSFSADSLNPEDLNKFTVRVFNNKRDKKRLNRLLSIQTKLEHRIEMLKALKERHRHNLALKVVIHLIDVYKSNLQLVIDRIRKRIASDESLVADYILPLQVGNGQASLRRSGSLNGDFKLELIAEPGTLMSGMPARIKAVVTRVDGPDHKIYLPEIKFNDSNALEIQPTALTSEPSSYEFVTGPLSPDQDNTIELNLYEWNSHSNKATKLQASLSMDLLVISDRVSPIWAEESTPSGSNKYLQTAEPISLSVNDAFGRINTESLQVSLLGELANGESLAKEIKDLTKSNLGHGEVYLFSGDINPLEEGTYTLQAEVKDSAGNLAIPNPWTAQFYIDKTPPAITFGVQDNLIFDDSAFTIPIEISDLSPVKTFVYQNGEKIAESTEASLSVNVVLVEGNNTFEVISTDAAGNESEAAKLNSIIFEDEPPQILSSTPQGGDVFYANSFPFAININAMTDKPLSVATVNGTPLTIVDKNIFGTVLAQEAGSFNLEFSLQRSSRGKVTSISIPVEIIIDNTAPVISSPLDSILTKENTYDIPVSIFESTKTHSEIWVNGSKVFGTGAKDFVANVDLPIQGENEIRIKSVDEAGNSAQDKVIKITKDSIAPILMSITPSNNSNVDKMIFSVAAVTNEKLASAQVNGVDFNVSGTQFSGQYMSDKNGIVTLSLTYTDIAGNTGNTNISINITDVLLVPSLISVVPDFDNVHMWIVGSPSAARPGARISAAASFFGNSDSTIVEADGSFEIRLDSFLSASVEAEDLSTGEVAETTVSFSNTTSLAGTVKDVFGSPLPGVTISFVGSSINEVTDDNGNFLISNPPTGDQTLIIDGSSVPSATIGPDKKFFSTKLAINVGLGQANQLGAPVFLTPLLLDGSQTQISSGSGATVTSSHAPGVSLSISSGATTFPDGSSSGTINMMTIASDRATTEVPRGFIPTNVISLEPSGTKFNTPVQIKVPNDNELPAETPMIFFSMNSAEGKWELDGLGKVSSDGQSVVTNPDSGITHFSLIYAVPLSPVIATLKNPNLLGISSSQGGLETTVRVPGFKILGAEVSPTLLYRSGWANPTAVVSNSFTVPPLSAFSEGSGTGSQESPYTVMKETCTKKRKNYIFWWEEWTTCSRFWEQWWNKLSYEFNWQSTNLWVPESIRSQFFVGSIASDQLSFDSGLQDKIEQIEGTEISNAAATKIIEQSGLPRTSIVSYAVELKDPSTGEYMPSGIHPSLARYQIKLKNLTITTTTKTTYEEFGRNGSDFIVGTRRTNYDPTTSIQQSLLEYIPDDLQSNILVQNKTQSEVGRGWEIGGVQRIYNPKNSSTVMIEEEDGGVATYALNSVINTVFDGQDTGIDLSGGVDLSHWPLAIAGRTDVSNNSYLTEINLSSSTFSDINNISTESGKLSSQGYYQCSSTTECDVGGCNPVYSGQFHSVEYPFTAVAKIGGIARSNSGEIFLTDTRFHGLYRNGGNQKIMGETQSVDSAVRTTRHDYVREFVEYFNSTEDAVNQKCNALFGSDCGAGQVDSQQYNCSEANIIRTCTFSSGWSQVITCTYTQEPRFMFTQSTGSIGVPGSGTTGLNSPTTVIGSPDGKLVIADTGNNRVISVDPDTGNLSLIAGNGYNTNSGDGELAVNAGIYHPRGLAYDNKGNLYISSESGYIRKVDLDGYISTFAGLPVSKGGVVSDQAAANTIAMNNPHGLVFDSSYKNLYVSDTNNNRVLQINLETLIANKIAGTGQCSQSSGDGRPALFADICHPTSLGLDDVGNLLIVEAGGNRIRRVTFSSYSSGALAFIPSAQDSSRLFKNADGTWVRQYRDGSYDSFDDQGYQVLSTDLLDRITKFSYDGSHNLTEIEYANGQKLSYNYSGDYLSSITDPAGRTTTLNYSGSYLSNINFPDGSSQNFQYDDKGQIISSTDQSGNLTKYEYNEWNRLSKVIKPDGSTEVINDIASQTIANSYNSGTVGASMGSGFEEGQASTQIVDGGGVVTQMLQDHMGFISTIKDAMGNITKIRRDEMGRPVLITKANGNDISYTYDPNTGDLLTVTDVETGLSVSMSYDSAGRLLSRIDGAGRATSYEYDSNNGLVKRVTGPDGRQTSYEYNDLGLVVKKIISKGSSVTSESFGYDSLGRLNQITDSGGKSQFIESDEAGNQIKITVTSNGSNTLTSSYAYDSFNRLIQVTTPNGEVTEYSYNSSGKLESILDSEGAKTLYSYDQNGRLYRKKDPHGGISQFEYNLNGLRSKEIDPNGNAKVYSYDVLNRISKIEYPDDVVTFQYDEIGNAIEISNSVSTIEFDIDSLGRISSTTAYGLGPMEGYPIVPMTYHYDGNGNRSGLSSSIANYSYTYDNANKITSIHSSLGETFGASYDNLGRLFQETRPGTGNRTEYSYNSSGLLSQISNFGAGAVRDFTSLSYDQRNLIVGKNNLYGTYQFGLDSNGQLTSSTNPNLPIAESFTYDEVFNRKSDANEVYAYDSNSQRLLDDGRYTYQYDNNGNMLFKTAKDSSKESFKYVYNSKNELIKVQATEGLNGPIIREANYVYDALGRRMYKSVHDSEHASDAKKTYARYFVYDGPNTLAEYDTQQNVLAVYTNNPAGADNVYGVYVTSAGVNAKMARSAGSYYFLRDHLGSVTAISNSSGNVLQRYDYTSFGELIFTKDTNGNDLSENPVLKTKFAFAGREYDEESGLIYMRSRYYDPHTGRFLQEDSYAGRLSNPMTVANRYSYAANNPLSFIDPTGHDPVGTITYQPGSSGYMGGGDSSYWNHRDHGPIGNSSVNWTRTIGSINPPQQSGVAQSINYFSAPSTYVVGISGSVIVGGGYTGSIGIYVGNIGEDFLDFGVFSSVGTGLGFSVGIGAFGGFSWLDADKLRGTGSTFSLGWGWAGVSEPLDDSGRPTGGQTGVGYGPKFVGSLTTEETFTFGLSDVYRMLGVPLND